MKTIGIIGGMGWPSSLAYYEKINLLVAEKLGAGHCANLILVQTDFARLTTYAAEGRWDMVGEGIVTLAKQLENAGAHFIMIACNMAHRVLPDIKDEIRLPIIHIVDVASEKIKSHGFKTVGLLGHYHTMNDDFFRGRLKQEHNILCIIPTPEQQEIIQQITVEEVSRGVFLESARVKFREVMDALVAQGCEAIIFGCTEYGRLMDINSGPVPIIDTLIEHVEAAVEQSLEKTPQ
ncbi:hypothetical protein VI817_008275 [Penicillium citrinum]|uniref:Aspartate racemase n=1 Tax=Penicillium hetheringtonii TaxID=911720 RepID=A0AAD6DKE4_9EURO|nr:aspartate racemase [Penicillium hetheringtonii]KAK5789151.1 hypothetical protein VI817_008275 [Penicillium citrinum]